MSFSHVLVRSKLILDTFGNYIVKILKHSGINRDHNDHS